MESLAQLHPQVVHFPVALLLTYTLLEIIGAFFRNDKFSQAAYIILMLGIIGAVTAVLTGNQAEELAELWEENGAIIPFNTISKHEEFATYTLFFFTFLFFTRTYFLIKKKFAGTVKYIFAILALAGCFLVYETAEEGGELVYKHGVGTELIKPGKSNHGDTENTKETTEGKLK